MSYSSKNLLVKIAPVSFIILLFSNYKTYSVQPKTDSTQTKYFAEIKTFSDPFVLTMRKSYMKMYSLSEKDFVSKTDSARSLLLNVLNKYTPALKPDFIKEQQIQIAYYFDKLLADYPANFAGYTGHTLPDASLIAARLQKHLPDLNNPALLNEVMFRNYVHSFLTYEMAAELCQTHLPQPRPAVAAGCTGHHQPIDHQ